MQVIHIENLLKMFAVAYPENEKSNNKFILYLKMAINNSDTLNHIGVFFILLFLFVPNYT